MTPAAPPLGLNQPQAHPADQPESATADQLRAVLTAAPRSTALELGKQLGIDDVALGYLLASCLDDIDSDPPWGRPPREGQPRRYWLRRT